MFRASGNPVPSSLSRRSPRSTLTCTYSTSQGRVPAGVRETSRGDREDSVEDVQVWRNRTAHGTSRQHCSRGTQPSPLSVSTLVRRLLPTSGGSACTWKGTCALLHLRRGVLRRRSSTRESIQPRVRQHGSILCQTGASHLWLRMHCTSSDS